MTAPDPLERLRAMCGGVHDGALLRVSLATALLARADNSAAVKELRHAVQFDPAYSAAWKLLGKTLADAGDVAGAVAAYRDGIAAAVARGDKQAQKEMQVFVNRLDKQPT